MDVARRARCSSLTKLVILSFLSKNMEFRILDCPSPHGTMILWMPFETYFAKNGFSTFFTDRMKIC